MGNSTADETIKAARKAHRCSWCGQRIGVGETYRRYRWFHDGEAGTCRMHPECHEAMREESRAEGGFFQWTDGECERPEAAHNCVGESNG